MVRTSLRLHERESSLSLYCPLQNSNKSDDIKGCRVSLTKTGLISAERCYVPHRKAEGKPRGMASADHIPLEACSHVRAQGFKNKKQTHRLEGKVPVKTHQKVWCRFGVSLTFFIPLIFLRPSLFYEKNKFGSLQCRKPGCKIFSCSELTSSVQLGPLGTAAPPL